MKDYYEILGVPEDASVDEIKKRYRELVKQYHPDLNKGDEEAAKRMAEINEAYQVLTDPKKRAEYDAMRKGGVGFSSEYYRPGQGLISLTPYSVISLLTFLSDLLSSIELPLKQSRGALT